MNNFIVIYFFVVYLIDEIILNYYSCKCTQNIFFLRIFLQSLIIAGIISFIVYKIKKSKIKKILLIVLLVTNQVLFMLNFCVHKVFSTYFSLGYMISMTRDVVNVFMDDVFLAIISNINFIILYLVPIIIFFIIMLLINDEDFNKKNIIDFVLNKICLLLSVALVVILIFLNNIGVSDINIESEISNKGLYNGAISYLISERFVDGSNNLVINNDSIYEKVEILSTNVEEVEQYEPNILDIDFDSLIENEKNEKIVDLHYAIKDIEPTMKSKYTGIFKDKILIQIVSESFSPYFVSKELTPTLYKLLNDGFVFDNFYAPNYGQSTIGGEFAITNGIMPLWIDGRTSADVTKKHKLPFTFPALTQKLTKNKVVAYHGGQYNYYNRVRLYDNWGFYKYFASGNGLEKIDLKNKNKGMIFDTSFIENVFENYILEQKKNIENNEPIEHFYYMTYSGHMPYNFDKTVSKEYEEIVNQYYSDYSEPVRAYIASQMDFEKAMNTMIDILKKNDMLSKVVICIATDHYPYALTEDPQGDLYKELAGFDYGKTDTDYYKSGLVLYNSEVKTIHIDTPCSPIDILPTLLNLFGYEYDSRLLMGRDILDDSYKSKLNANNIPIVIFPLFSDDKYVSIDKLYGEGLDKNVLKDMMVGFVKFRKSLAYNIQSMDYYNKIADKIE